MKIIQKIKLNIQSVLAQIHTWYKANTTSLPTSINDDIYTHGKVGIGYNKPETRLHLMDSSLAQVVIQTVKDGSEAQLLFKAENNPTQAHRMARGGIVFRSGNNIWGNGDLHLCNYHYNYWGLYLNYTHAVISVHGNKEVTFKGYPNTRNDTDTPENLLFTNANGRLRSKKIQEVLTHLLPKTYVEEDNVDRSFVNGWDLGQVWQVRTIRDGYDVKLHFEIPVRNDSTNWGGGYLDIEYSVNGSPYTSIGNTGYQLVMGYSARIITTYARTIYLKRSELSAPSTGDFTLQFRFKYRSYDGTLYVNLNRGTTDQKFSTLFELSEMQYEL